MGDCCVKLRVDLGTHPHRFIALSRGWIVVESLCAIEPKVGCNFWHL
jgi:hypothetical protein